jgi:hypothetical protein
MDLGDRLGRAFVILPLTTLRLRQLSATFVQGFFNDLLGLALPQSLLLRADQLVD